MRKPMVAGNWKMNKTMEEAAVLVSELLPGLLAVAEVEKVLCPPFTSLMFLSAQLEDSDVGLGAQNLHWETSGAYTGEISPQMVRELCKYVIIGHSERRAYFGETDETVNKKLKAALAIGLIPIVCIGETLSEYEAGKTGEVVRRQVLQGFKDIETGLASQIVVAYEPVWAIGTGKTASPAQAQEVHEFIRDLIEITYSLEVANDLVIQYGGSVKPDNAKELISQKDIDGALVGGACLKADSFMGIIKGA